MNAVIPIANLQCAGLYLALNQFPEPTQVGAINPDGDTPFIRLYREGIDGRVVVVSKVSADETAHFEVLPEFVGPNEIKITFQTMDFTMLVSAVEEAFFCALHRLATGEEYIAKKYSEPPTT